MKKILWVNPSFLDYRIPLYYELNHSLNNNFKLIFSKERIPERVYKKVKSAIGSNAIALEKELRINFGNTKSDFANSSLSIPFPKGLYKAIKKERPDVIIAEGFFQFTPWAMVYAFFHRIPLYIAYERTAHTERLCPIWRKLYRKFVGKFVNGYIANGKLTKEYLISQGVKPENIQTGGMSADSMGLKNSLARFHDKDEFEKSIGLVKCEGIRFIYAGQLVERKGIKYLIDAWYDHIKLFPCDQLLIVGEGELIYSLKEMATDTSSIVFTGKIDYNDIYKYYGISDVFVIPTLEDNWSLVVPEAMACGLPIASSIYNGCHPELVQKDINGITFDTFKKTSIIDALAYFHNVDLSQFSKNSIEIEDQFNPKMVSKNVLNLLNHKN